MLDFLKDLIDNDTLIIIGLLIVIAFMLPDVQAMIVGGLLACLKTAGQNGGIK